MHRLTFVLAFEEDVKNESNVITVNTLAIISVSQEMSHVSQGEMEV